MMYPAPEFAPFQSPRHNTQPALSWLALSWLALSWLALCLCVFASPASALTVSPFSALGTGGSFNGQTFDVGADGDVFEFDTVVGTSNQATGTRLSSGSAPAGLSIGFAADLASDNTDILLTYTLTNTSAGNLDGVFFVSFLDAEIAEPLNTFFNEYATANGALAPGQSFEVDEPGFVSGDIFDNALTGNLDNTNPYASAANVDDISIALGWSLGTLSPGQIEEIQVVISEDGGRVGTFDVTQMDAGQNASSTHITFSSTRVTGPIGAVPEPGAALLFATGIVVVASATNRSRNSA